MTDTTEIAQEFDRYVNSLEFGYGHSGVLSPLGAIMPNAIYRPPADVKLEAVYSLGRQADRNPIARRAIEWLAFWSDNPAIRRVALYAMIHHNLNPAIITAAEFPPTWQAWYIATNQWGLVDFDSLTIEQRLAYQRWVWGALVRLVRRWVR